MRDHSVVLVFDGELIVDLEPAADGGRLGSGPRVVPGFAVVLPVHADPAALPGWDVVEIDAVLVQQFVLLGGAGTFEGGGGLPGGDTGLPHCPVTPGAQGGAGGVGLPPGEIVSDVTGGVPDPYLGVEVRRQRRRGRE